jgi:hypothetical protein
MMMSRTAFVCILTGLLPGLAAATPAASSPKLPAASSPKLPSAAPAPTSSAPRLSAAQIVERSIAARGGLSAWRSVQALSWSGKMDAGGGNQKQLKIPGMPPPKPVENPGAQAQLPFVLEMKRARKQRLEIRFNGQTAVQVYDGTQGWKVRPFLNRRDVEPYTSAELAAAADQADLDGPLVDYVAKGTQVELEGVERVEGRTAYRLRLTLKDNHVLHDWIDAQSLLEVKMEGTPRRLDGRVHPVNVLLRDYRSVNGLQIPHLMETVVDGVARTEKIQIEKVEVNPRLDEARFRKPG